MNREQAFFAFYASLFVIVAAILLTVFAGSLLEGDRSIAAITMMLFIASLTTAIFFANQVRLRSKTLLGAMMLACIFMVPGAAASSIEAPDTVNDGTLPLTIHGDSEIDSATITIGDAEPIRIDGDGRTVIRSTYGVEDGFQDVSVIIRYADVNQSNSVHSTTIYASNILAALDARIERIEALLSEANATAAAAEQSSTEAFAALAGIEALLIDTQNTTNKVATKLGSLGIPSNIATSDDVQGMLSKAEFRDYEERQKAEKEEDVLAIQSLESEVGNGQVLNTIGLVAFTVLAGIAGYVAWQVTKLRQSRVFIVRDNATPPPTAPVAEEKPTTAKEMATEAPESVDEEPQVNGKIVEVTA